MLASDVQVGPPGSGEEDEVRFTLTSEAGLNDGLAFPFVNLAIALAAGRRRGAMGWLGDWVLVDVALEARRRRRRRLAGRAGARLADLPPAQPRQAVAHRRRLRRARRHLPRLWPSTELAHGYGFLAVFVAALALRATERHHDYHEKLHDFAEQIERLLMMVLLVLFGGALGRRAARRR